MPSKSPYAPTFKATVTRGTPCWTAVTQIATKKGVNPSTIFKSLHKAGFVQRQKFSGQWIYWPTFTPKHSAAHTKTAYTNLWQAFVDWCICSGYCTPRQFTTHAGSQTAFTKFFAKFWQRQFPGTTSFGFTGWPISGRISSPFITKRSTSKRRKTRRTTGRKTRRTTKSRSRWSTPKARRTKRARGRSSWGTTYKISRYRKYGTRRYRRAA